MASARAAHRHILACPVCKKPQQTLGVHLRRKCMKTAPQAQVRAAVEAAKGDLYGLESYGRFFTRDWINIVLDSRDPHQTFEREMTKRFMVFPPLPPAAPQAPVVKTPSSSDSEQRSSTDEGSQPGSESSGETFQCDSNPAWKDNKRARMAGLGLYNKHSRDHPLLKAFEAYLYKDIKYENCRQEVDNVARILYQMDPAQPSLLFVRDKEKTRMFIRKLTEANLTHQTQIIYLKSLKRFLHFHTTSTNLSFEDPELHKHAMDFMAFIGVQQTILSKGVSKEIVAKREGIVRGDMNMTPYDCQAVLRAARSDFLAVVGKIGDITANRVGELQSHECLLMTYYLAAVVVLEHMQRTGVVENMTLEEWNNRTCMPNGHVVVAVKEHKTAGQEVAGFVLNQEQETWFIAYSDVVREQLKACKRPSKRPRLDLVEENPKETFFLSSNGTKIYNCSNDLHRFHAKYKLPNITSQTARRVFETSAKTLPEAEKTLVVDYLSHSTATANRWYRMKTAGSLLLASQLIQRLAAGPGPESSPSEPGPSTSSRAPPRERANPQAEYDAIWDSFLAAYPVTLDGNPPSAKMRREVSHIHQRKLYEHWLKRQMKLRVQHALCTFSRRCPTESRLEAWITKQEWKTNAPSAASILNSWEPVSSLQQVPYSKEIRRLVSNQKRKGLKLADLGDKGTGVLAGRRFLAGEVVCDYQGITANKERAGDPQNHEPRAHGVHVLLPEQQG